MLRTGKGVNHRITEPLFWVGRDLKDHQRPTPLAQGGLSTSRSGSRPRCPGSHPTLNISMDRASTASLFHHLTTFSVKNFPLTSNLNIPSLSLIYQKQWIDTYTSTVSMKLLKFQQITLHRKQKTNLHCRIFKTLNKSAKT